MSLKSIEILKCSTVMLVDQKKKKKLIHKKNEYYKLI